MSETTFLLRATSPVANYAALPATGNAVKLYLTIDDAKLWRWDTATTAYVQVGGADNAGTASATVAAHVAAADPHGDRSDAASKYQPLSAGKGLSTEDYTSAEKTKLAGIAAGATSNAASTANPRMDGTAAPGTAAPYAREDHVHPTDTSRAPLASPTFTGTPSAPTASASTSTTQIATTAMVQSAILPRVLTGFTPVAAAAVAATDTVLGGIQKLQAQLTGGSDLWKTLYLLETGGENCVIPLIATGDGTGVFTLRIWSDVANTARLSAGAFYGEIGGTTNLGTTVAMSAGAYTTFYIKVPSGTATMTIDFGWALTLWGNGGNEGIVEATNAPKLNGFNIKYIPSNATTIRLNSNQNTSIVTGNTKPWPAATYIYFIGNSFTLSGTTYAWPAATYILFNGNSIALSGTTYAWTASTYIFFLGNSMSISGSTYPWTASRYIVLSGSLMAISGTTYPWTTATYIGFSGTSTTLTANLSTTCTGTGSLYLYLAGTNIAVTYPTSRAWPTTMREVYLRPSTGSMVQADVDRLFIDVDTYCTTASIEKVLDLRGDCAAPSSASATARTSLGTKGFTVSTN